MMDGEERATRRIKKMKKLPKKNEKVLEDASLTPAVLFNQRVINDLRKKFEPNWMKIDQVSPL